MSIYSAFLRDALNNHVLRNVAYVPHAPFGIWVALFNSDPGDIGSMSGELTGAGYARASAVFATSVSGTATNSADVTFPAATADWIQASFMALCDASSGGNILFHTPIPPVSAKTAQIFKFPAGTIIVTP